MFDQTREQRLVMALGDEKGLLLSPLPSDETFAARTAELNDWAGLALSGSKPTAVAVAAVVASEAKACNNWSVDFCAKPDSYRRCLSPASLRRGCAPMSAWRNEKPETERKPAVLPRAKLLDEALQLLRDKRPALPTAIKRRDPSGGLVRRRAALGSGGADAGGTTVVGTGPVRTSGRTSSIFVA